MKKKATIVLDKKDTKALVDVRGAIRVVEEAFKEYGRAKVLMPPKLYLHLDKYCGDFRAMPAYVEKLKTAALKWVNVHPLNKKFGLPAVMGLIILSDPRNGFPLCIMDGTFPTSLRTAAAGAVAAKYLARKNSKVAAMVGCGVQARTQLEALSCIFKIKEVRVWGARPSEIKDFIKDMGSFKVRFIAADNIKNCVKEADIVVTTTPSRKPLVKLSWLKKGAHINAIGADARGKQELDIDILKKARVIVDAWEQAAHSGEINVAVRKKVISKKDIYADIGQIVSGRRKIQRKRRALTVFDSTGLAIQDVAVATLIYKAAIKRRKGKRVNFI